MKILRRHYPRKQCHVCRERQARTELKGCCHRCARTVGVLPPRTFKDTRAMRNGTAEPIPSIWVPADWQQPRPPIARVIDGQEFLVMWDGA